MLIALNSQEANLPVHVQFSIFRIIYIRTSVVNCNYYSNLYFIVALNFVFTSYLWLHIYLSVMPLKALLPLVLTLLFVLQM